MESKLRKFVSRSALKTEFMSNFVISFSAQISNAEPLCSETKQASRKT